MENTENEVGDTFEEKVVTALKLQQEAAKKTTMIQIANFILSVFLFIFMVILVSMK